MAKAAVFILSQDKLNLFWELKMAKVKRIENHDELFRELSISSINGVKDKAIQKKLAELAVRGRLSENLIRDLVKAVPELAKAFSAYVVAFSEVGCEVEKTKQSRWDVLKDCAKNGVLTGDQILEAMKIIQDCEKNDSKFDWDKVHDIATKVFAGLSFVLVLVAGAFFWAWSQKDNKS
jgi:hypothetical protein